MRVSKDRLNPSFRNQLIKTFAQTLLDFKNLKEAETFLLDFFKESELETFIKRLGVSYWLKKGRSYANVRRNLKVSAATVSAIRKMLGRSGLTLALKNMEAEEWASLWSERIKKIARR